MEILGLVLYVLFSKFEIPLCIKSDTGSLFPDNLVSLTENIKFGWEIYKELNISGEHSKILNLLFTDSNNLKLAIYAPSTINKVNLLG